MAETRSLQIKTEDLVTYLNSLRLAGLTDIPWVQGDVHGQPNASGAPRASSHQSDGTTIRPTNVPSRENSEVTSPTDSDDVPSVRSTQKIASDSPTGHAPVAIHVDADSPFSVPLSLDERERKLHELRTCVANCKACPQLASRRKNTVFGVGNLQPRVCFFGEAPGADEDAKGEPFVGAAGQLLDKILAACTFSRENVYILNSLKCRPPGNRNPEDSELANCKPFWVQQLDILQPEFIVCLGSFAVRSILQKGDVSIRDLRGKFHDYRGAKVVVTYHPAYLLRHEPAKKSVWEDMQMLMREMGIPIPGRK